MRPTRIALIPVYQPTEILPELLREMKSAGFQIIVVNDGSGFEKSHLFQQAAEFAEVLEHSCNMGKGRAIKTGLSYIRSHYPNGDYVVVTMDGDGQHRVSDAITVCRTSQANPNAIILGSRRLEKNVPLRSQFGNTVTRFVYHIATGQKVWDTQTGLRAFNGGLIPLLLSIPGERYEYEMNVLLICSERKIPIVEEEIDTVYFDGNSASHFDTLRDSYRIYREILKFSAASLTSFFVDYGLYSLLTRLTMGMESVESLLISNMGARVVSASVNYTLNRRLVFRSNAGVVRSALQYAALAGFILAGNTLALHVLADWIGINRYLSKLITELLFFSLSWVIQRQFVFRRRKDRRAVKRGAENAKEMR